jgi:divalent metal cation (Fe/Co/Zn/Cd) transporter
MIVLTSWPSARSASACSSACSTTPPQKDHEYGTTMPTFIAAIIVGAVRALVAVAANLVAVARCGRFLDNAAS